MIQIKSKDKAEVNVVLISKSIYEKHFCVICQAKGLKTKCKIHNIEDCYNKSDNESKKPTPQAGSF